MSRDNGTENITSASVVDSGYPTCKEFLCGKSAGRPKPLLRKVLGCAEHRGLVQLVHQPGRGRPHLPSGHQDAEGLYPVHYRNHLCAPLPGGGLQLLLRDGQLHVALLQHPERVDGILRVGYGRDDKQTRE